MWISLRGGCEHYYGDCMLCWERISEEEVGSNLDGSVQFGKRITLKVFTRNMSSIGQIFIIYTWDLTEIYCNVYTVCVCC